MREQTVSSRIVLALCAALYFILCAKALWTVYQNPYHNYDMIPYVGAMLALEEPNQEKWYARTMEEIKKEVSPKQYEAFQERMETRKLWNNSEALRQNLPFYTVKPFYVGAAYALHASGVPTAKATWLVSLASLALLAALLWVAPSPALHRGAWWLACAGFLFYMPLDTVYMARLSTPDMISTLLMMAGIYALMVWRSIGLWYAFAALTALSRPDMIPVMCMVAFCSSAALHEDFRLPWRHALITAVFLFGMNAWVSHLTGFYGWKIFMEYALINKAQYPAQLTGAITMDQYLHHMRGAIDFVVRAPMMWIMLAWTALVLAAHYFTSRRHAILPVGLIAVAWLHVAVKTILFAQRDERFYYASYLLCFVGGMMLLASALAWRKAAHDR